MTIEELTKKILVVKNLVRYEFVEFIEKSKEDSEEVFMQLTTERLGILQSFGELKIDKTTKEITLNHNLFKSVPKGQPFSYLNCFSEILNHIYDTYLIVLIAL